MLLANGFRVSVAQSLSKVLGWLAVLFIASTTTFVAAFCFTNLGAGGSGRPSSLHCAESFLCDSSVRSLFSCLSSWDSLTTPTVG